jgi:hypothetical protein
MRSVCWFWLCLLVSACSESKDGGCREDNRYIVPFGDEDLTFHVGPYQEHTTTTTAAIGWETLESGDTRLEYGPDDSYGKVVTGAAGTMHQVALPLPGLQRRAVHRRPGLLHRAGTGPADPYCHLRRLPGRSGRAP